MKATIAEGPQPPRLLLVTFAEAARVLGGDKPVTIRHVERLVAAKQLRAVGKSRARRVVYQSILDYIARGGT